MYLRSLQPEPSLRQVGQKATQAAALAAQCTEASIPADLLHAHSWGLTHRSFCSLGVLLPVSSRQEIGLLPVISVSTSVQFSSVSQSCLTLYDQSFHCVPWYLLYTSIFYYILCFILDIVLWAKLQFTDFLNSCNFCFWIYYLNILVQENPLWMYKKSLY